MFNLRREQPLSKFVPWRGPLSDLATLLNDGSVLAILEVEGTDWHTAEPGIIEQLHNRLNTTIKSVARDDLILTTIFCRGMASIADYPTGSFRSAFAAGLDAEYRDALFDRALYKNRTYLCVQMRPARYAGDWLGDRMDKRRAASTEPDLPHDRLARLEAVCAVLEANLLHYRPCRLGNVVRNGMVFSEAAEAIAYALTGIARPVPLTTGSQGRAMLSETIIFGAETIEIRGPGHSQFVAMLGMANYPANFWPEMFAHLHATPFRHTVMHSWLCLSNQSAEARLSRKQNRMVLAGDKAHSQIAELSVALDQLQSGRWALGDHAFAMAVFADAPKTLGNVVTAAWRSLADAGVIVAREGLGNQAAFCSIVPGNHALRLRPGAISSRAFAAFSPLHGYPAGDAVGYWGEPVAIFRTHGGTPYRFHFHVGELGNVFVSGMSRSGKSTWLGFITAQAEKAGAQIVVWDKDRGLEIAVRAMGGSYSTLRNGTPNVAPLKALDGSSPLDFNFLRQLLRSCIAGASGYEITPEEDRRLALGIKAVMALPPADRWLEDIRAFLPHSSASGAGARLEPYCWGRELGWIIDGPQHRVDLTAPVIGFDQTEILDHAEARGPIMATLFYLCESLIDGRRLLFVIDEFWKSLQDPQFAWLVHDKLKTLGKRGAAMILATQSPRDALNSIIAHTIREQCPTGLHFSNPVATDADYGEQGIGLTPTEIGLIRSMEQGTGTFLLKQGYHSLLAQVPLGTLPKRIGVLSGRTTSVALLDRVRAELGDHPDDWLPEFEARLSAPASKTRELLR